MVSLTACDGICGSLNVELLMFSRTIWAWHFLVPTRICSGPEAVNVFLFTDYFQRQTEKTPINNCGTPGGDMTFAWRLLITVGYQRETERETETQTERETDRERERERESAPVCSLLSDAREIHLPFAARERFTSRLLITVERQTDASSIY